MLCLRFIRCKFTFKNIWIWQPQQTSEMMREGKNGVLNYGALLYPEEVMRNGQNDLL